MIFSKDDEIRSCCRLNDDMIVTGHYSKNDYYKGSGTVKIWNVI